MPETQHTEAGSTDTDRSTAAMFGLLADERRQLTLQYLAGSVGAVPLGELADGVALREGEYTADHGERVATSLFHTHLPKLAAAGLVDYDRETALVSQRPPADRALDVLEFASRST